MRISRELSLITLDESQLLSMVRYCEREKDILALYVYGSYGTPHQTPLSDVDLAVLPMPRVKWDIHRQADVSGELTGIGKDDDVNLVNLRRVPSTLQFGVLKTGKLLFCRDANLLADFVAEVIVRHADFSIELAAFYRDYDVALREEFL